MDLRADLRGYLSFELIEFPITIRTEKNHESETGIDDLREEEFKIKLPEATELTLFSVDFSMDALIFLLCFFVCFGVGRN